jgi:predicted dehydrogenase
LAPHDISIMLNLMDSVPTSVSCSGLAYLNEAIHDVCTLNMHFENNRMGIVHVSWLDPHKKREMTVVGSKKMAVYNDIEPLEKVKVYDHGVDTTPCNKSFGEIQVSYRYGDMYSPRLNEVEPLKAEVISFFDCISQGQVPKTDGRNGWDVVSVIEAADISLRDLCGDVEVARPAASVGSPLDKVIAANID